MQQNELVYDLKLLSGYVYKSNKIKKPDNWFEIDERNGRKTGFYACTFMNGDNIVISFRGTDKCEKYNFSKKDVLSDIMMVSSIPPAQIINATKYYNDIKKRYPNKSSLKFICLADPQVI